MPEQHGSLNCTNRTVEKGTRTTHGGGKTATQTNTSFMTHRSMGRDGSEERKGVGVQDEAVTERDGQGI